MPNRKRNLLPDEQRRLLAEREKRELEKIERETKRQIFIERYKEKIFKYMRWGAVVLVFIFVFAAVVNIILERRIEKPKVPVMERIPPKEKIKIEVEKTVLIPQPAEDVYDAITLLKNPDVEFGISRFSYKFILKDDLGNVVGEQGGESYLLPQSSRYQIEIGIKTKGKASVIFVEAETREIQKLKEFENPQKQMKISDHATFPYDQKTRASANILNESPFGYDRVDINFILYDEADNIVAVNYTNINAFVSGEKRQAFSAWNYPIPQKISRVEVEPNVNVFESGAFMRQYGEGQILEY